MARREKSGGWISFAAVLFYPIAALAKRTVRGKEHIPLEGGAILAMNHVSHLDPVVDAVFVHKSKRVPRMMAKDSLFRKPLLGGLIKGCGAIPVYRGTSDARASLRDAIAALEQGKFVVIYPEGTITKDPDGWPMTARTGVARLALETGVPVIPAARWGTQEILNGYTKKFRPFPRKPVQIVVGEPIDVARYRDQEVTAPLLREVTAEIMTKVRDLLAELREEPAPEEFYSPKRGGSSGQAAG